MLYGPGGKCARIARIALPFLSGVLPAQPLPTLRQASEILALNAPEADRGYPVDVEGVVIYRFGATGIVVQNGVTGLFARIPDATPLERGDRIRIAGKTEPGGFAPIVAATAIRYLGRSGLPAARRATLGDLRLGAVDNTLVEVSGQFVSAENATGSNLNFRLETPEGSLPVNCPIPAGFDPRPYIDAEVRVVGTAGVRFNRWRQRLSPVVHMSALSDLHLVRRSNRDPESVPLTEIGAILIHGATGLVRERVRVRGVVTLADPEMGVYIQEFDRGIAVERLASNEVRVGERIEVWGLPFVSPSGTVVLIDPLVKRLGSGSAMEPAKTSVENLLGGYLESALLSVEAEAVETFRTRQAQELLLRDGDRTFSARIPLPVGSTPLAISPGGRVRVVGVARAEWTGGQAPRRVQLLARGADGVSLVAPPPWSKRLPWVPIVLIAVAFAAVAFGWARLLRRQVRLQTEELRAKHAQLEKAMDESQVAARAKSDFLANMSHEIRTPMNAVIGLTSLVLATENDPERRGLLEKAHGSAVGLLDLLNAMIDFSKIEAGGLKLEPADFALRESVERAVRMFEPEAREKGLHLSLCLPERLPPILHGDGLRLRQALGRLIANAVKFTESGGIAVTVREIALRAGEAEYEFEVADTGVGIAADKLDGVFREFEQADTSMTRKFGGAGLGLTVARRLVELMRGRIWVESREGHGSAFRFTSVFGRDESAAETPSSTLPAAPESLDILVAEDNRVNQVVIRKMLERAGHRVTLAGNGKIAVQTLETRPFDVVLMDIQMPEMDGLEATRAIRASERGTHVPIVAVTAHALAHHRNLCLEAGMDDYVTKPVNEKELLSKIAACIYGELAAA